MLYFPPARKSIRVLENPLRSTIDTGHKSMNNISIISSVKREALSKLKEKPANACMIDGCFRNCGRSPSLSSVSATAALEGCFTIRWLCMTEVLPTKESFVSHNLQRTFQSSFGSSKYFQTTEDLLLILSSSRMCFRLTSAEHCRVFFAIFMILAICAIATRACSWHATGMAVCS